MPLVYVYIYILVEVGGGGGGGGGGMWLRIPQLNAIHVQVKLVVITTQ